MNRLAAMISLTVLASAPAYAQSVMLPLDNGSSPPANTQSDDQAQSGTVSRPAGARPAATQRTPSLAAPSASPNLPGVASASGVTSPAVQGLTPDQVAQARRAFEALAASNPEAARLNPFARFDALVASQTLEREISAKIRDACQVDFFNVSVPIDIMQNPTVLGHVKGYGVSSLVSAMRSVCSDPDTKDAIQTGFGMLTIQHKMGQSDARLESLVMSATFSYDFTSDTPPNVSALADQLRLAAKAAKENSQKLADGYKNISQDGLQQQVQQNIQGARNPGR